MKRLAIITARGGSKRIPRKNIKEFCGKPIIAYSIEAALSAGIFDTVMVSTDDEEIAEIARGCGAEVPFLRSPETSGDFASTADVVDEVLTAYEERGEHFDAFCCIYPTAPFLTGARLSEAARLLEEQDADGVVPVVRFGFPPQRCVVMKDGFLEFKWPENRLARSQDLEPFYHDAGQFYYLKTDSFKEQRQMFPAKTVPLVLEELEVQDIDNEVDWKMAEVKFRILQEKEEA
ncbi:MAG: pseudaminic acid cytidylyltransferase [Lachnospiraceae bacterium]|nr:pseudaminic acid cytidylyltransferase [Lachnospiraceae bacterium]